MDLTDSKVTDEKYSNGDQSFDGVERCFKLGKISLRKKIIATIGLHDVFRLEVIEL